MEPWASTPVRVLYPVSAAVKTRVFQFVTDVALQAVGPTLFKTLPVEGNLSGRKTVVYNAAATHSK